MRIIKTIRLLSSFYGGFFPVSFIITVCCALIVWHWGLETFFALFWFKLFTLGVIVFAVRSHKSHEFYYYQNLGVSQRLLWTGTLTFDLALFVFLVLQINTFR